MEIKTMSDEWQNIIKEGKDDNLKLITQYAYQFYGVLYRQQ